MAPPGVVFPAPAAILLQGDALGKRALDTLKEGDCR